MSPVTHRYFVAEGARAAQVAAEGLDKANATRAKRSQFLDEHMAAALWGRRYGIPIGIAFHPFKGDKLPGFLAPKIERHDGTPFWIYKPDRRTTIGKNLLTQMAVLAEFNFSDFACAKFGVAHSIIGSSARSNSGLAMYHSVAGYISDRLVFKIPFGGDQDGGLKINVDIPADFREIKKSEFIAITEEAAE